MCVIIALRQTCGGLGAVACVNCKGEGVTVPIALQRKETDIPLDEFEAALDEMGIAALAANYVNTQVGQCGGNQLVVFGVDLSIEWHERAPAALLPLEHPSLMA